MSSPEINMTNPPKAQTKMVKIRAKYPIRTQKDGSEHITQPGETVDVSEDEAKEFCDKTFDIGHKEQFGNFENRSCKPTVITRAERVK